MADFLTHEQQRKPELAAGVMDTSRAAARTSEVCQLGVAKATHEAPLPIVRRLESRGLRASLVLGVLRDVRKGGVHEVGTVILPVIAFAACQFSNRRPCPNLMQARREKSL